MEVTRRLFMAGGAAAGLAAASGPAGVVTSARAAAPKTGRQFAGVHRMGVGDIEVNAVLDGYIDFNMALFPKADPAEVDRLRREAFLPPDRVRGAVNAYVVNTGDRLVLIDSGARDLLAPSLGRLPDNLKAAGIDPASIDTVLLTHMHPDHVGGLLAGTAAAFPNADMAVSETEWGFWYNDTIMAGAPDGAKRFFTAARDATAPYKDRLKPFSADVEVAPGISAMALPGHTPGHTGFMVSSGDKRLLIWGDIVHASLFQFAHPDWTITFDVDQDQAAKTRLKAFDMAVADRLPIAGMHIPFPGFGHVDKSGDAYAFVPAQWQYEL